MIAPAFWQTGRGPWPHVLAPVAALVAHCTARRLARPGWRAPVPVICCGNATVGGAGKTTLALDLGQRLAGRGLAVHFLSRGHGGTIRGPHRVDPARDPARMVGDEPLLLAGLAPTWIGADRAETARAAIAAGADVLVMDDGLQNSTLVKTTTLLVIDGARGFGNGRVLPAGPLREPVAEAAARATAAVLIGADAAGALARLPPSLPILRAHLVADAAARALAGVRVLAFAGIAHPEKFYATLAQAGAVIVARRGFPDHHRFRARELAALEAEAARLGARPVTTPKDAVRLPPVLRERVAVAGVGLAWTDPAVLEAALDLWLA